jgi:hypothetical protein
MKDWIQRYYAVARYDPATINIEELRRIVIQAWEAVLQSYIDALYDSWRARCQAVIDAQGGPTRY